MPERTTSVALLVPTVVSVSARGRHLAGHYFPYEATVEGTVPA